MVEKVGPATVQRPLSDAQSPEKLAPDAQGQQEHRTVTTEAGTEKIASGAAPTIAPSQRTLDNVQTQTGTFINQPGRTGRLPDPQRTHNLAQVRTPSWGAFRRLLARIFPKWKRVAGPQQRPPTTPNAGGMFSILAQSARSGVDAAKQIVQTQILDPKRSADDVLRILSSGDKGIRRATTALHNVENMLNPASLDPATLHGTPEQWKEQTLAIQEMAKQISKAGFSGDLPVGFTQYGTSNNPFAEVVNNHPGQDGAVRDWLAEGVYLTDQLLAGQERAEQGRTPLDAQEMDRLQERVSAFADASARTAFESQMDIDINEILK